MKESLAIKYKPKEHGKSDFYSWNLYRWLKKQDKEHFKLNRIYDSGCEFQRLYIGRKDDFFVTGVPLRQLCSGSSTGKFPMRGAYTKSSEWKDITDDFFAQYEKIGVCAIHNNIAHNWRYLNDRSARLCENCGKIEKKVIVVVEEEMWEVVES